MNPALQARLQALRATVEPLSITPSDVEATPIKRGTRHVADTPENALEIRDITDKRLVYKFRKRKERERCIAILDMETDPFDNVLETEVKPFLAVLYSDQFSPIVIWEEDHASFIEQLVSEISKLPDAYTIYAHNGGRFDYMFLVRRLRGTVKFKGRGIMSCRMGNHELRDSFHIIPEKLANWKKDDFDYSKLTRERRTTYREEITRYCINDCKYLLQIIRGFVRDNGLALSIGQASLKKLQSSYTFERIGEHLDGKLRGICTDYTNREQYGKPTRKGYFYGGRVECIAGAGHFVGTYKLYDVNSMYPHVMASFMHPVGSNYTFRDGAPSKDTCFLHLTCTNNGALISRADNGETTSEKREGDFYTTIWEYQAATELGLISNVSIKSVVDCDKFSNFSGYVLPLYAERQKTKAWLASNPPSHPLYDDTKLKDICIKLYLNNAYGKFAQNPRRFREHYLTGVGEYPEGKGWGTDPMFESADGYCIWTKGRERWSVAKGEYVRDHPLRFYNIGTGASITGAARSILLRAIAVAGDPIYCDTDSLICKSLPLEVSSTQLGAWKLEKTFDEVIIAGKKQYGAKVAGFTDRQKGRILIRSKGVTDMTWREMLRLLEDQVVEKVLRAPTLNKYGDQYYVRRKVKATAAKHKSVIGQYREEQHASAI